METQLIQRNVDRDYSQLSDYSASFLDIAMQRHPSVLTMFTLDSSRLTRIGLASVQRILFRSNLEYLEIICTPFTPFTPWYSQSSSCFHPVVDPQVLDSLWGQYRRMDQSMTGSYYVPAGVFHDARNWISSASTRPLERSVDPPACLREFTGDDIPH